MKIQTVLIDKIKFDTNNARIHDQKNLEVIQGSLEKFGQRKPIVIDHLGNIVAGNGTVEAALLLGWTEIDAVTVPKEWDKETIMAFALADNRTAELAEWNPIRLAEQLMQLEAVEFNIQAIGFEQVKEYQEKVLDEFPTFSDEIDTTYKCPKCFYEWNGVAR